MTFGSLFSGIGGLDLGLERAGMVCKWQVEKDEYCQRVLAKHWPGVKRYGDIRELSGDELERVDLIAGGFHCQPVSLAGRRLATDDERWLWPEFARLIRVLRPRIALLENVPGLLSAGMGEVLGDLAAIGFDAEWCLLSACTFGAPHTRERVFIVAYANSAEWRTRHPEGCDITRENNVHVERSKSAARAGWISGHGRCGSSLMMRLDVSPDMSIEESLVNLGVV